MSQYQYRSLAFDKREIRLFTLIPNKSDEITGSISTVSLNSKKLKYDALSYVWGDDLPKTRIFLTDGTTIQVGPNLLKALQDFNQTGLPQPLWIDAICINQHDVVEKQNQIPLMSAIYRKALVVRAWLNHEIDLDSPAFDKLPKLVKLKIGSKRSMPYVSIPRTLQLMLGIRYRVDDFDHEFWAPVTQILYDSYWSRLWIQQEFLLAKKLVLHCRKNTLPGESIFHFQAAAKLASFAKLSRRTPLDTSRPYLDYGRPDGCYALYAELRKELHRKFLSRPITTAYGLLSRFVGSGALDVRDPRDRVYGNIGLFSEETAASINVDYSLSVIQVYSEVFRVYMTEYNDLNFLCFSNYESMTLPHHHTIPTWMPAPEKDPIMLLMPSSHTRHMWPPSDPEHLPSVIFGNTLLAEGFRLETINETSRLGPIYKTPILDWFTELIQLHTATEFNPRLPQKREWFQDKKILELFVPSSPVVMEQVPSTREIRACMEELAEICRMLAVEGSAERDDLTLSHMSTWRTDDILYNHLREITLRLYNGSCVITESAKIGLVFNSNENVATRSGDQIWAINGCGMPLVLRPVDSRLSTFSLVGCAKLPGLSSSTEVEKYCEKERKRLKQQSFEDMSSYLETGWPGKRAVKKVRII
jgi:hypothetical protein